MTSTDQGPWTSETIETARLVLRCPDDADRPALDRILTDAAVRRYLGGPVDDELLERLAHQPVGRQSGVFIAERIEDQTTLGTFSIEDERDDLELSYQLLPEFWGQGYATEAAMALLDWCWRTTDADSIIAVTQTANTASLALLERLGFAFDTTFVEYQAEQTQVRLSRR